MILYALRSSCALRNPDALWLAWFCAKTMTTKGRHEAQHCRFARDGGRPTHNLRIEQTPIHALLALDRGARTRNGSDRHAVGRFWRKDDRVIGRAPRLEGRDDRN
jgi:hypothetical protein